MQSFSLCVVNRLILQGVYHEKVVPVVCALVSDAAQPVRIRGHAAAAIVNLTDTEGVPEEAITPHFDALLSALCSCLNSGVPQSVQVRGPLVVFFLPAVTPCIRTPVSDYTRRLNLPRSESPCWVRNTSVSSSQQGTSTHGALPPLATYRIPPLCPSSAAPSLRWRVWQRRLTRSSASTTIRSSPELRRS